MSKLLFKKGMHFSRTPVFILMLSSAVAQVLNLFVTAYLSRYYPAEAFGIWAIFQTTAVILAIVSTGRYEFAIMLPQEEKKAKSIVRLALNLSIFFSIIIGIIVCLPFTKIAINYFEKVQLITQYLYLLSIAIFCYACFQIFSYWYIRKQNYKLLAFQRIFETVVIGIICLLFIHDGIKGLVLGNIAGIACSACLFLGIYYWQRNGDSLISMRRIAKEYVDFPINNILQAVIEILQFNIITFSTTFLYGTDMAGYYAIGLRILQAPAMLLVRPIAQVYFIDITNAYHKNESLTVVNQQVMKRVFTFLLPIIFGLLFFASLFFSIFFGENWRTSGVIIQLLCLWFLVDFIRVPLTQLAVLYRRQTGLLLFSIIGILLTITISLIAYFCQIQWQYYFAAITIAQIIFTLINIRWLLLLKRK
ncbi:MAG: oligosaccharide flippase family protein [Saprospiraceae bacterium]|nr:oligosaccharide flippase family protein [Saprospiraceae bacterium]